MPRPTNLKKTTVAIIDVTVAKIVSITATLDDGTTYTPAGPVVVGDNVVTITETGEVSIVSDADFQAEEVVA